MKTITDFVVHYARYLGNVFRQISCCYHFVKLRSFNFFMASIKRSLLTSSLTFFLLAYDFAQSPFHSKVFSPSETH